jgi:hypothetical protein
VPFKFPIVVIDFEATALTSQSYPVEVGVAIIAEPGAQIETWSTLIKPDPNWDIEAQWDPDAERVHGISRWALREGKESRAAMAGLNACIPADATAWCDGGHYDVHWLEILAGAAGVVPTFKLHDLGAALRQDDAVYERYLVLSSKRARPHRAGPDAAEICAALAAAIRP